MIFFNKKAAFKQRIIGRLEGVSQELLIGLPVLNYISRYRQLVPWAKEAGGQLFGTINKDVVCVVEATGPYNGDKRSRHEYRSDLVVAQQVINKRHGQGLLYLGEWHTHAEDCPIASFQDGETMRGLIVNSRLNSSSLLMLIAGRASGIKGLAVWSVSSATMRPWQLRIEK
jgi:integrative and conjugative element protein (TIGR02256 family)